ncbi:MAG TPA: hypothetical protein VN629_03530 [Castellaniella sp.]|nr:hypothetical protein [Castellaniella sp.]
MLYNSILLHGINQRMPDRIVDAARARSLHAHALRIDPLAGWVVMRDPPAYPAKIVAHLVIGTPSSYVFVADTLAEIHAMLPSGLVRSDRQPADPPEVLEAWFPR